MLEYAAHASETWTANELRRTFEAGERARRRNPDEVLAQLLQDDEPDADGFWDRVSTNLAAKRLRLLFIADRIPDRLARVVEFLNSQMRDIEVLALEVKRFSGTSGEMFVPRVIGRTAKAAMPSKLTWESFLADFGSDRHREAAARLLDVAKRSGAPLRWGKYQVAVNARCSQWRHPITVAWLHPPWDVKEGNRWTRGLTFGTNLLESDPGPEEELRALLAPWADHRDVPFAEEAAWKGHTVWTVSYDAAAKHIDDLAERLEIRHHSRGARLADGRTDPFNADGDADGWSISGDHGVVA